MFILKRMIIARQIENALARHFPGAKFRVAIHPDESWDCDLVSSSKERFDDLYPGMTKKQADRQVLQDIIGIVREYIPNAEPAGYERYGKYHKISQR